MHPDQAAMHDRCSPPDAVTIVGSVQFIEARNTHVMSRWYRPPTPTLYESIDEDLDALEIEDLPGAQSKQEPLREPWSPAVYAALDESEDEAVESFDEDEEDMHASGIPAARGWRLDARYVASHI